MAELHIDPSFLSSILFLICIKIYDLDSVKEVHVFGGFVDEA